MGRETESVRERERGEKVAGERERERAGGRVEAGRESEM